MSRTSNFSPSPSNSLRTVSLSPSIKANNFFSKMKNMMKLQSLIPNKDKKNKLEEEQFLLNPSASTGLYITRKKLTTSSKNKKLCRRKTSIENDNDKENKLYLVPKIRKRNSAINVNTKELMTSTSYNRYKLKNTDRILLANMQIIDRNRIRKIKDMTPMNRMREIKSKLTLENFKITKMFYDFNRQIADNQQYLKIFTTRLISARRNLKY